MACEILVPQSRIKPVPAALEAHSRNHRTTGEVPLTALIAYEKAQLFQGAL